MTRRSILREWWCWLRTGHERMFDIDGAHVGLKCSCGWRSERARLGVRK